MRFGINFFPTVSPEEKSGAQFYDECLELTRRADELGYNSVKTVEHYFFAYGGYSPDPVTFLTAAAMVTKDLRLVTGAVIPAFSHPCKLAGKLAMLDNISHGRLDVGFARAFLPDEFAAFQTSMEESRDRFNEGIEACRRLWSETDVVFKGKFHQFGPVTMLPRPYQKPHPPIWVAATFTAESFEWAGRNGYNLMIVPYVSTREKVAELLKLYRDNYAQSGKEPGTEQIQMSYHCYIAEDGEAAQREGKLYFDDYTNKLLVAVSAWSRHKTDQYKGYEHLVEQIKRNTYEDALRDTKVFVGTPAQVAEQIAMVREWYGEVEPSLQINFGNMPHEAAQRSLELFAAEVMPKYGTRVAATV
ncbi:MAG: LLM class flavin-dependent oxidoreductase [Candidatus Dormibacteraeota bacterium]|nr:LLM class flavin-dependent oxidoreductase [Candidatus Dormibacteraeota bacterium]MBV9524597.1 LLM class flavin-dependent oxidoreductase [Candidatus Dormibacteraeota bacterium]